MTKNLLLLLMSCATLTLSAQNLLATFNEGFEGINPGATGNTPYYWWNFYNDTAGGATLTNETTEIHGGANAAKVVVTIAANGWEPQLANGKTLDLIVGRSYNVTFWIKAVTGGGTVQVSDNGTHAYGPNTVVSTSWQQYSHTFVADANNVAYQVWIHLGGTIDTYYVDDVSIVDTTVAGLDDINANGIVIYPNPVSDKLFLKPNHLNANAFIISDILGKTVRVINDAQNVESIDVSYLKNGLYILTTDTKKQFKFIKSH